MSGNLENKHWKRLSYKYWVAEVSWEEIKKDASCLVGEQLGVKEELDPKNITNEILHTEPEEMFGIEEWVSYLVMFPNQLNGRR